MNGGLSGQPTEFKYCRYPAGPAPKGRCNGNPNQFLPFDGL